MASIVSAGTTSATALNMSADTTGVLQLASNNGTVGLTMDTSQNVGIGTASPSFKMQITAPVVNGGVSVAQVITNAGTGQAGSGIGLGYGTTNGYYGVVAGQYDNTGAALTFSTSALTVAPSERMRIDSSGNVGIGTASPAARLQVAGAYRQTGATVPFEWTVNAGAQDFYKLNAVGFADNLIVANSAGSVSIGQTPSVRKFEINAIPAIANQLNGIRVQMNGVAASVSEFLLGTTASGVPYTSIATGNDGNSFMTFSTGAGPTERARIDSGGGFILAGSTAQKATGTTWSNPSDQRLKDNIRDYEKGLVELMQVRVREWEYNGKGGTVEGTKGLGVVADEVMVVLPNTVENYEAKLNSDDVEVTAIKKFDATEITWLLVKAIQEQQALIVQLQADVAELKGAA
jgi:hypothetical protein